MKPARTIFCLLLIHLSLLVQSQQDPCDLRISLLTCSPGKELYSTFGHTAIRVTDSQAGMDVVFNYGTFDDSDPDFYINFTKGLMVYALSTYPFADFIREYSAGQRGVTEQLLQLDCSEKQKLFTALRVNAQQENRFYNYYFHTDNCTTRSRDIIAGNTESPVQFKNILPAKAPSYRNLIHEYLVKGDQPWSKLAIDILLGSNLDKKVSNEQAMFLPDYLVKGFDHALMRQAPLVASTQTILPVIPVPDHTSWFTPLSFFTLLLLVIAALSVYPRTKGVKTWRAFDLVFFLFLGLLGVLLTTLWMVRVDDVCRNNYNLFWALPFHLPLSFFLLAKRKKWVNMYFKFVCVLCVVLAAAWLLIPQQLNTAVLPLLGIILIRSYQLSKKSLE